MKIVRRIGDLMSANVHDLIDTWEDPEVMMRQALRELEDTLHQARDSAARVIASERLLQRQLTDRQAKSASCQHLAISALATGDEQRARQWLTRRQLHETVARSLSEELSVAKTSAERLKLEIELMHTRLTEARHKLSSLRARRSAAKARRQLAKHLCHSASAPSAMQRVETLMEKIDETDAETDVLWELYTSAPPQLADLESANDGCVDAELDELKRQIHGNEEDKEKP